MKRNKETGIFELDNNEEKFEGVVCKIGKVSQDGRLQGHRDRHRRSHRRGHTPARCSQKEGKYELQPILQLPILRRNEIDARYIKSIVNYRMEKLKEFQIPEIAVIEQSE